MQSIECTVGINLHVMWYEIELLPEFLESLVDAIKQIENQDKITLLIGLNTSQAIEKIDTTQKSMKDIVERFNHLMDKLSDDVDVHCISFVFDHGTMINFRRNYTNELADNDYIVWGETDCLVPQQFFLALDHIKQLTDKQNVHKYVTTFATRKMWDKSWAPLEHTKFENAKYYEKSEPEAWTEQSSIRYTMSKQEMDDINLESSDLDLRVLTQPKFDGSLLCLSSSLVKAGVNIPLGMKGISGEDAAMIELCRLIMGQHYLQVVVKNVLKVHNREHPKKRLYVLNSTQQDKGELPKKFIKLGKDCLNNIFFNKQGKL